MALGVLLSGLDLGTPRSPGALPVDTPANTGVDVADDQGDDADIESGCFLPCVFIRT